MEILKTIFWFCVEHLGKITGGVLGLIGVAVAYEKYELPYPVSQNHVKYQIEEKISTIRSPLRQLQVWQLEMKANQLDAERDQLRTEKVVRAAELARIQEPAARTIIDHRVRDIDKRLASIDRDIPKLEAAADALRSFSANAPAPAAD